MDLYKEEGMRYNKRILAEGREKDMLVARNGFVT